MFSSPEKRVTQLSDRPVAEIGRLSDDTTRQARVRIEQQLSDRPSAAGKTDPLQRRIDLLKAYEDIDAGDTTGACTNLFFAAFPVYMQADEDWPASNLLANAFFALGRLYLSIGDYIVGRRSFQLAATCWDARNYADVPTKRRNTLVSLVVSAIVKSEWDIDQFRGITTDLDPRDPLRTVMITLLDGVLDLNGVVSRQSVLAAEALLPYSDLAYVLLTRVIRNLLSERRIDPADALEGAQRIAAHARKIGADEWLLAEAESTIASAMWRAGRSRDALQTALSSWTRWESCLPEGASGDQRATLWKAFADARTVALDSACDSGEDLAYALLIEAARGEATVAVTVTEEVVTDVDPKSDAEARNISNSPAPTQEDGASTPSNARHISAASRPALPLFFKLVNDAFAATNQTRTELAVTPRAVAECLFGWSPDGRSSDCSQLGDRMQRQMTRHGISVLLGLHMEGDVLYSAVWRQSGECDIDRHDFSADDQLLGVLEALHDHAEDEPTRLYRGYTLRVLEDLASWNSPEEQFFTRALARIIPPAAMASLVAAVGAPDAPVLGVAFTPELACVPWPIICFGKADQTRRLVEYAAIRVWTTLGVEEKRKSERTDLEVERALLFDNPRGLLRPANDDLTSVFNIHLCDEPDDVDFVATREGLRRGLQLLCDEPGRHMAFLRSHAYPDGDPAYAAILTQDEPLYAGELFGVKSDGDPVFPMPERVVLACCSSSTASQRIGSSVGFAAGCLVSGAESVVATGIDVYDSSFTNALDAQLARDLTSAGSTAHLLRAVHLRLLRDWKVYSVRGLTDYDEDIRDPHPVVWAYYWCF